MPRSFRRASLALCSSGETKLMGLLPTYQTEHPPVHHPQHGGSRLLEGTQLRLQPLCSAAPGQHGQGSGHGAHEVPACIASAPATQSRTRVSLENKCRITWKSWKLTLFYILEKHWVFHTIFKHKMFIFLFNLYSFSGLLVPLTLSVYKGWTIQAIAT